MHISQTQLHLRNIATNATALAALIGDGTTKSGDSAAIERLRVQLAKDFAIVDRELAGAPEAA